MSKEENKPNKRGSRPRKTTGAKPENYFHKTGESDGRKRGPRDGSKFADKKTSDWNKKPDRSFGKDKPKGKFTKNNPSESTDRNYSKGNRTEFRNSRPSSSEGRKFGKDNRTSWREDRPKNDFRSPKPDYKSRTTARNTETTKEDAAPAFKKFGKRPVSDETIQKSKDRQVGAQNPAWIDEKSIQKRLPKKVQEKIESNPKDESIRLNRYIANAGLCSRREADELIAAGMIKVNGEVVTEMGFQVEPGATVKYGKDVLSREKMMYVMLNKPKDFITTMDDPKERKTVMDLVAGACRERIYPVGRLDRNTTGLLLLTNDGELTAKLTHPSSDIKKIYQAELDKPITEEHFEMLKEGIELEDGFIKPDEIALVTPDAEVIGIKIHSGKNRIVRRMFEHLGYEVTKLDRTTFADLTKKDLPRGNWRFLTEKEIIRLKYLI